VEVDPTRATIQQMQLDGSNMTTLATRFRNAIALTLNPVTGALWAGGAGQDDLPTGHPYEFMDPVTLHGPAPVDYGWPDCEENHVQYSGSGGCANTVAPALEFPAYATNIGAVFYPSSATGAYAFPSSYQGGLFVTHHGSWHSNPATPPSVSFVAMNGDAPVTPVNWSDPTVQWTTFLDGLGTATSTSYKARPTGIAVGPQGSLFISDDQNSMVYRIRPHP
jgi:glucose/arabinose dehydrogenase